MDLATTVERIQQNFCICDPNLPDNPIVFASDGFLEMSRYDRFEVLGRNCRFMQARGLALPHGRVVMLCCGRGTLSASQTYSQSQVNVLSQCWF